MPLSIQKIVARGGETRKPSSRVKIDSKSPYAMIVEGSGVINDHYARLTPKVLQDGFFQMVTKPVSTPSDGA